MTRGVYPRPSLAVRFWTKVDTSGGLFACWPWQGAIRGPDGYGALWHNGRHEIASRVAFELANGPIPDGMAVCHRCDNPPCCNPAHLFAAPQVENIADKTAKHHQAAGSRVATARLNEAQVAEIRRRFTGRRGQQRALAIEFGVCETVVSGIVRRKTWRHVA